MIFDLKCGNIVRLTGFLLQETYSGWYGPIPDEEWNRRIQSGKVASVKKAWGERRMHIIPPTLDSMGQMPNLVLAAWLSGTASDEDLNDRELDHQAHLGSELVLFWYVDEDTFDQLGITGCVQSALDQITWKDVAEYDCWP